MISDPANIGCRYNCDGLICTCGVGKRCVFISWNVNGIRAVHKKGFLEWFESERPDVLCVQETKAHEVQLPKVLKQVEGYSSWFTTPERKGYSGVGLYTREFQRSPQRYLRPWRRALRQ